MLHRNDNMLLRIAQGDSYAMAAEYVNRHPEEPEHKELFEFKRYLTHPTYHKLPAGTYTDDTQMSIAVSEALLYNKAGDWDDDLSAENFMDRFFVTFKRDQRDGYSRKFQEILEVAKDPVHFRELVVPTSTKNGAAMRSVPFGVMSDVEEMKAVAMRQARTTHDTYEGVLSSVLVALMSHFALHDPREFSDMTGWLATHLPMAEVFREPWVGPVQSRCVKSPYDVGVNTAWAVHTLLTTQTTLLGIMKQVLEWGGDTDSVAAIAWGIASCRMREDLPAFFEDDLEKENGSAYGPAFLKDLGKKLMDAYDVKGT
jgi:ADP-ribosylglycohydrolase